MAKQRFDYSQFEQFAERLNNFDATDGIRNGLLKAGNEFIKDVRVRTPVKTGKLKKAWEEDNLAMMIIPTGDVYELTLYNNTEYASWVENGHNIYNQYGGPYGWVYGRFFLRATENVYRNGELGRIVKNAVYKELRENIHG